MGRLYSLISLAMLAVSTGSLPQRLHELVANDAGLKAYSNSAATLELSLRAARVGEPATPATAEERQLAAEASPETAVLTTPLMGAILKASKSQGMPELDAKRTALAAYRTYEENQAAFISVVWAAPAALLTLGGLLLIVGAKGGARMVGELCHSLAGKWLFLLSIATAVIFMAAKVNLWTSLPSDLWAVPVVAMLASGMLLRVIDFNFPVWNSTISALIAPLASCLFILGYARLAPLIGA